MDERIWTPVLVGILVIGLVMVAIGIHCHTRFVPELVERRKQIIQKR